MGVEINVGTGVDLIVLPVSFVGVDVVAGGFDVLGEQDIRLTITNDDTQRIFCRKGVLL